AYSSALADVEMVIMLSSMLHSIGVGNMLPSWVKVVCVDINPAVVTKLSDRGSTQTIGIVTDVGLFLHQLATALR
ncbi:MAG: TIGR00300 family protein, partial [Vicinamibacterales bacterium]